MGEGESDSSTLLTDTWLTLILCKLTYFCPSSSPQLPCQHSTGKPRGPSPGGWRRGQLILLILHLYWFQHYRRYWNLHPMIGNHIVEGRTILLLLLCMWRFLYSPLLLKRCWDLQNKEVLLVFILFFVWFVKYDLSLKKIFQGNC